MLWLWQTFRIVAAQTQLADQLRRHDIVAELVLTRALLTIYFLL